MIQQNLSFPVRKLGVKDMIHNVLREIQEPLIESGIANAIYIKYRKVASGSSISRYLRYLQTEQKVHGEFVIVDGRKKNYKKWRAN